MVVVDMMEYMAVENMSAIPLCRQNVLDNAFPSNPPAKSFPDARYS
jgi:hypothetical protein